MFVRHGETVWNREERLQGRKDVRLSELGKKQAGLLAKRFQKEKIDVIYSSDLRRALETAETIAKYHPKTPIRVRKELSERSHGIIEGLTLEEIKAEPELRKLLDWEKMKTKEFKFPKGESKAALEERVEEFLDELVHKHPRACLLLVCHGGAAKAALKFLLKEENRDFSDLILENASVTIVSLEKGKARLGLLNDISHLQRGSQNP